MSKTQKLPDFPASVEYKALEDAQPQPEVLQGLLERHREADPTRWSWVTGHIAMTRAVIGLDLALAMDNDPQEQRVLFREAEGQLQSVYAGEKTSAGRQRSLHMESGAWLSFLPKFQRVLSGEQPNIADEQALYDGLIKTVATMPDPTAIHPFAGDEITHTGLMSNAFAIHLVNSRINLRMSEPAPVMHTWPPFFRQCSRLNPSQSVVSGQTFLKEGNKLYFKAIEESSVEPPDMQYLNIRSVIHHRRGVLASFVAEANGIVNHAHGQPSERDINSAIYTRQLDEAGRRWLSRFGFRCLLPDPKNYLDGNHKYAPPQLEVTPPDFSELPKSEQTPISVDGDRKSADHLPVIQDLAQD